MGRVTTRRQVTRLQEDGDRSARVETVAVEEPLEIRIDGVSVTTTMRTPGHDIELVHGFLLGEGVISTPEDIVSARYCAGATGDDGANTYNLLDLTMAEGVVVPERARRTFTTTSACGVCGTESIAALQERTPYDVSEDRAVHAPDVLLGLPERLAREQRTFARTGGVHAAGLMTDGARRFLVREDVGRHNALDKVLGRALLDNLLPARGGIVVVSGRASFELVQKAAMAGVPALVAVSAPSSLAVDLAEEVGMTLVAFTRRGSANVYSHPWRLRD